VIIEPRRVLRNRLRHLISFPIEERQPQSHIVLGCNYLIYLRQVGDAALAIVNKQLALRVPEQSGDVIRLQGEHLVEIRGGQLGLFVTRVSDGALIKITRLLRRELTGPGQVGDGMYIVPA
jgi:hypothetical protein